MLAGGRGEVAILVVVAVKIFWLLAEVMAVGVIEYWLMPEVMVVVVVDSELVGVLVVG